MRERKPGPKAEIDLDGPLTFKESLFVSYYLGEARGNGSQAARLAGYKNPTKVAHQLGRKLDIQAAIAQRLEEAAMSSREVLARLSEIASVDIAWFVTVTKDDIEVDWDRAARFDRTRLIRKLKKGRYGIEVEVADPINALIQLAKYHGLLNDHNPYAGLDDAELVARLGTTLEALKGGGQGPPAGGGPPPGATGS